MTSARDIQELLLGAGGFLGTCMAGVGAYRLFSGAARGAMRMPTSMEKTAEYLGRVAQAVESQNVVSEQVMELKALLMTTREDILKIAAEREQIGRELRLMSRKIEACGSYVEEER